MLIRDAVIEDAPATCECLKRSIAELCVADHHNNPKILKQWLANKTPKKIADWITTPGNSVLLAVELDAILAVGAVTDDGDITSNYVSPDARFRGISKAMMKALEARAIERGNKWFTLTATETARTFYHSLGYAESGPPDRKYGTSSGYPMSKIMTR